MNTATGTTIGLALALSAMTLAATGTEFARTNDFTLPESETLSGDLWLWANRIDIAGAARGDLFLCASAESAFKPANTTAWINISGRCENDVWAMGNKIRLTGTVNDHARLLATAIEVSGTVTNSAFFLGNAVQLAKSSRMEADAWLIGENLVSEGRVCGDLTLVGKSVTLGGTCEQDVYLTAADIVVLPGTEIMGNLIYRSNKDLVPDRKAIIHGRLVRESLPAEARPAASRHSRGSLLVQAWLFLGAGVVGMVLLAVFPAFVAGAVAHLRATTWRCILVGLLGVWIIPLLILFTVISVIGIPLGLLLCAFLMISTYLGRILVAVWIGALLFRAAERQAFWPAFAQFMVGLFLLFVAVNAGALGLALWLLVTFAGFGAVIMILFHRQPAAPPA